MEFELSLGSDDGQMDTKPGFGLDSENRGDRIFTEEELEINLGSFSPRSKNVDNEVNFINENARVFDPLPGMVVDSSSDCYVMETVCGPKRVAKLKENKDDDSSAVVNSYDENNYAQINSNASRLIDRHSGFQNSTVEKGLIESAECRSTQENHNSQNFDELEFEEGSKEMEVIKNVAESEFLQDKTNMGGEEERDDDEIDIGEHDFIVGDLVWGKIEGRPWWPGSIIDPPNKSDDATNLIEKGLFRVSYFGNASISWCNPSQLKPFKNYFLDMFKQSNSKRFINAIVEALNECNHCVKMELTCQCVPKDIQSSLSKLVVVNSSTKERTIVPRDKDDNLSIHGFEPAKILDQVKEAARTVSVGDILEFTLLKGRLAAFSFVNKYRNLVVCSKIEENEGDTNSENSTRKRPWFYKKFSQMKSQKSLGELLAQIIYSNHGVNKGDELDEETRMKRSTFPPSSSNSKVCPLSKEHMGSKQNTASRKRKKSKNLILPTLLENPTFGTEDTTVLPRTASSPRERKRSKYLSPPYTMELKFNCSVFPDKFKQDDLDTHSAYRKRTTKKNSNTEKYSPSHDGTAGEATNLPGSSEVGNDRDPNYNDKISSKEIGNNVQNASTRTPKLDRKNMFCVNDSVSLNEMISELHATALNPFNLKGNRFAKSIVGFVMTFRNSTYQRGSNYEIYNNILSNSHSQNEKLSPLKDPNICRSEVKSMPRKKRMKAEARSHSKHEPIREEPATLVLSFAPGLPLPTKEDLLKVFSKFGKLKELETKVLKDLSQAEIIYERKYDAEQAFNSSESINSFAIVSCRLYHTPAKRKAFSPVFPVSRTKKPLALMQPNLEPMAVLPTFSVSETSPSLVLIQQNLESMMSVLERSGSREDGAAIELSSEMKTKLVHEVNGLLKKVTTLVHTS